MWNRQTQTGGLNAFQILQCLGVDVQRFIGQACEGQQPCMSLCNVYQRATMTEG